MVKLFSCFIFLLFLNDSIYEVNNISNVKGLGSGKSLKQNKQSVDCCLDSILGGLSKNSIIFPGQIKGSVKGDKIRVIDKDGERVLENKEVRSWLSYCVIDSVKFFQLNYKNDKYFIFSSSIRQATGLSANFTTWLLFDVSNNTANKFESLSDNCKAFYYDLVHNKLVFTSFDFNERFIHEKDFDNIIFDIKKYVVNKSKVELVKTSPSRCGCTSK